MTTTTTKRAGRTGRTPKILGLPIEGTGTQIIDGLIRTKRAKATKAPTTRKGPKLTKEERELAKQYHGAPVPATKVFKRRMKEFKNCQAFAWMILNEVAGTATYANSYGQEGDGMPRSSWNPEHYTYPIVEKVIAKHMDIYEEVEVTEWPSWVTQAKRR